ncbi:hypothetical protein ES703_97282 [subsurface metagenome]
MCVGIVVRQLVDRSSEKILNSIQHHPNELRREIRVGTKLESMGNGSSFELERISNQYENFVLQLANIEFNRILTALHLSKFLRNECIDIFGRVWRNLRKGAKGRIPEKLAPVILYMLLKANEIDIDLEKYIDKTKIEKTELKEILMEALRY